MINYELLRSVGLMLAAMGGFLFWLMMIGVAIALGAMVYKKKDLPSNTRQFLIWFFVFACQLSTLGALFTIGILLRFMSTETTTAYLFVVYAVALLLMSMAYWLFVLLRDTIKISFLRKPTPSLKPLLLLPMYPLAQQQPASNLWEILAGVSLLGLLTVAVVAMMYYGRRDILRENAKDESRDKKD